jgi:Uma2 family endonuclease
MVAPVARRRFTVDDYERMAEAGILAEDDRVELIAGEIVEMSPIGDRHVGCVNVLADLLWDVVGREALISVQNPIRLSADGEPQPDIALLRRGAPRAVPTPEDVLLVIEVADSSRDYDRTVKLPLYAAAGIRETWLVDLVAEVVERHTDPHDGVYRRVASAGRGESLQSTVLPAVILAVDAILG